MSGKLEALQRKIGSGEDLHSIVRTMKALAGSNVRQYERAVESLGDYYRTVEMGLAVVLASQEYVPEPRRNDPRRPVLLVVFGSDYGLAGRFNEQIVSFALEDYWRKDGAPPFPENRIIACAGEQAYTRLLAAGAKPDRLFSVPVSLAAITPAVQSFLEQLDAWLREDAVGWVLLFYNSPLSNAGFSPRVERLLPVDLRGLRKRKLKWPSQSLPTFTMPAERLLSALLRQYFFVSLFRAFALSLAAEKNIDERLDRLKAAFQQERQTAITEELLDIITGFKALRC